MLPAFFIDFDGSAGNLAIGASSVSVALPANTELLGLSCTGNCHFHISSGAAVATVADPVLTSSGGIIVLRISGIPTPFIAVIQDGAATGNFNFFRVKNG